MTAFDILGQVKLEEITYISLVGEQYFLGFEDVEEQTYNVANPVYTGNIGMNGKLGVSRVYKSMHEVKKTKKRERRAEITESDYLKYKEMIDQEGLKYNFQNVVSESESKITGKPVAWVIYLVK